MNIFRGGAIPNSYPALYLTEHKALVVADLHIGYESALKAKGICLPHASYVYMRKIIAELIRQTGAESIIFLGDLKHEFGKPSAQEWVEVRDLLESVLGSGVSVHAVRGNHDNYILSILGRYNVQLHDPWMLIGDIVLLHGDKDVELPKGAKIMIMGHEHPAVSSVDVSGSRYKFKCFLIGRMAGIRVIVLPALSPLSSGVGINETPKEELLSPILRRLDIDSFTPIAVEQDVGIFRFPQIGFMRSRTTGIPG